LRQKFTTTTEMHLVGSTLGDSKRFATFIGGINFKIDAFN